MTKNDEPCVFCAGFGNVKGDTCWGCKGSGKNQDAAINLGWEEEPEEFDRTNVKGYNKPKIDWYGVDKSVDLNNEEQFESVVARLIADDKTPWSVEAINDRVVIGLKSPKGQLLIFEFNSKPRVSIYNKKKPATKKAKTV